MNLTKEYIAAQKECIEENYKTHKFWKGSARIKGRYMTLKRFCEGSKKVLCVGSGGVEPIVIGATHAVDVDMISGDLLREQGWKGSFFVGSCDDLANNWGYTGEVKNRKFDVAVCSEVIEHLPDLESVKKTFQELDRVAKCWIVTTPAIKINDKGHKFFFDLKQLQDLIIGLDCKIKKSGIYFYIYKDGKRMIFND